MTPEGSNDPAILGPLNLLKQGRLGKDPNFIGQYPRLETDIHIEGRKGKWKKTLL